MKFSLFHDLMRDSLEGSIKFILPNGNFVPPQFHITDVGVVSRDVIDCGGVKRQEQTVHLQLWLGNDLDHKLTNSRALKILGKSQCVLSTIEGDPVIIIEYQVDIGNMSLFALFEIVDYKKEGADLSFYLDSVKTNCLVADRAKQARGTCCVSLKGVNDCC